MNIKLILLAFITFVYAQTGYTQAFWKKTEESRFGLRSNSNREIIPERYQTFRLDINGLRAYLKNAPVEFSSNRNADNNFDIELPMPNGLTESFVVKESAIMESELAARYPDIKTYKGFSPKNPTTQIRFSVSPRGFHAAIHSSEGEHYIDPYSSENIDDYIVYYTRDHKDKAMEGVSFCGVNDSYVPERNYFRPAQRSTAEVALRVYRLAIACTGEWGSRRGTVALALADMVAMVNRLNLIYEKDMAVRFILINENDKLIFLNGTTDPYDTPLEGKKLVGTNTSKLNAVISSTAYDIGHVLTISCTDGIGGVAQFGSLCQFNKGNGVTCHGSQSISIIVTRILAHEIGHQFNASHSWNVCTSSTDQRSPNTAFEPGSGTTIMSYAGSCGTDNVAADNDDYFHVGSLDQMYAKTLASGNAFACAQKIPTGNHFPVVTKPSKSHFLPVLTPFELAASASDEDGDALTYCWEQYDTGEASSLGNASATAPLFRSFRPSATGDVRFFPRASNIASGILNEKTEVLPNTGRKLSFRITVRDNNPAGSGVVWDDYSINTVDLAGPFKLIYPEVDDRFKVGQVITVKWDVANTDIAPVNCKAVNIYGSFNGILKTGDPNLVPLALNVPNDGTHDVIIPNRISNFFRIVIKAADNIFLTSSILPSKIEQPTVAGIYFETSQTEISICQPNTSSINFNTSGLFGFNGDIKFEIASILPEGMTANFASSSVKSGNTNSLNIITVGLKENFSGVIVIRASANGVDTLERTINLNVIANNLGGMSLITPANGVSGVLALPVFSWNVKNNATSYDLQVATGPDFTQSNIVFTKSQAELSTPSATILNKSTIHYWRVRAVNSCGPGPWSDIQAFITEALSCNIYKSGVQSVNISSSGSPSVEIPVLVDVDGSASDINVKLIRAEHNRLVDLEGYLIAPSGKTINLWSRKCGTQKNLNLGLDDQSADFFQCPINTGVTYRPENPLTALNNESIKGNWRLRLDDKQSGEGGRFQEFNLEICSNISISSPFLVKNEGLKIHPGNQSTISNLLLLISDNNNAPEELIYTLVTAPAQGRLFVNGVQVSVGAKFTQAEINAAKLLFDDTSGAEGTDFFSFTVTNGQGGWVSITKFQITRSKGIINSTNDSNLAADILIAPNPATNVIQITATGSAASLQSYTLVDVSGRVVMIGGLIDGNAKIMIDEIAAGLYFIRMTDGVRLATKKIVKY
jgi:subtilisin-like proprotein convertase family protein